MPKVTSNMYTIKFSDVTGKLGVADHLSLHYFKQSSVTASLKRFTFTLQFLSQLFLRQTMASMKVLSAPSAAAEPLLGATVGLRLSEDKRQRR